MAIATVGVFLCCKTGMIRMFHHLNNVWLLVLWWSVFMNWWGSSNTVSTLYNRGEQKTEQKCTIYQNVQYMKPPWGGWATKSHQVPLLSANKRKLRLRHGHGVMKLDRGRMGEKTPNRYFFNLQLSSLVIASIFCSLLTVWRLHMAYGFRAPVVTSLLNKHNVWPEQRKKLEWDKVSGHNIVKHGSGLIMSAHILVRLWI